jgi:N-acetylglucosamine-6-phosphate deacetylase
MLALTALALYTPLQQIDRPLVLVEDGVVASVGPRIEREIPADARRLDFKEGILAPGLIDIHIHGAGGFDVMQPDAQARGRMERFLAARGVTSYFPTTVTAPVDTIIRALENLADGIERAPNNSEPGSTQPLGIHLEGPFLSHARKGVHPPENLLPPTLANFERFWQAARGHIRVMTIAPELEGAAELIAEATKRGVCISMGHSDADLKATRAAVAAGARHATHTFNAMRPLDHREPGILGEVLSSPALTADIIADGIHVHPSVVRLFLRAKGPERAVLITDGTAAAGMPDGKYWLGSMEMDVKDGRCLHQGTLAGSALTLDRAVHNAMQFGDWTLQQALRAATLNPATVANAAKKGKIEPGLDADLLVLTAGGQVQAAISRGVVAHS